jgi:hypothetical protein
MMRNITTDGKSPTDLRNLFYPSEFELDLTHFFLEKPNRYDLNPI